jgi:carbon monoxide dehydrogenase subunit G
MAEPVLIFSYPRPAFAEPDAIELERSVDTPVLLRLGALTKVERDPDAVFAELHDPRVLLTFLPGSKLSRRIDSHEFEANVVLGFGPLKVPYAARAKITASDSVARTAAMTLHASPRALAPPFQVRMAMAINSFGTGSRIEMRFLVALSGRRGRLARAWLDPIACDLVERTVMQLKRQLETAHPAAITDRSS